MTPSSWGLHVDDIRDKHQLTALSSSYNLHGDKSWPNQPFYTSQCHPSWNLSTVHTHLPQAWVTADVLWSFPVKAKTPSSRAELSALQSKTEACLEQCMPLDRETQRCPKPHSHGSFKPHALLTAHRVGSFCFRSYIKAWWKNNVCRCVCVCVCVCECVCVLCDSCRDDFQSPIIVSFWTYSIIKYSRTAVPLWFNDVSPTQALVLLRKNSINPVLEC